MSRWEMPTVQNPLPRSHLASTRLLTRLLDQIPPRVTFAGQMVATFVSTIICAGVIKFQMDIPGVCTLNPPMRFKCPSPTTFFTASVLWGSIGPIKVFGRNGQYKWLLLGFPLGVALVLAFYGLKKLFPNSRVLGQVHVVAAIAGGLHWAPYSIAVSAIIMLFSVQWVGAEIKWWGNAQPSVGCEGTPCTLKALANGERFYPWWDASKVPAP
ncbi:hypothetical protein UVI_02002110 [Ustilaginoidea virens]|uniref:Uncharacterized protein n=1 Tax=Ustilaginoidea virens TaxID=1159556 RepID=A0A1B5L526_USTVR|nr:hypothetical protein UVI_02002110 [Ustilaginoidea virens]